MKSTLKNKILKSLIVVAIVIALFLAIYLPLKLSGVLSKIDSIESLKQVILNGGVYSYLIFCLIQFAQVSFLPIPAAITTVAGTLVFGPWITIVLSFVSVMAASLFSFFIGKKLGRTAIIWIAGKEQTLRWEEKLNRGKYVFFLMMLFPVFPDDILCLIVGATGLSYKFFTITNLITRPIGIVCTCLLGSGTIIPFTGWGIYAWIGLILIGGALFYLSFKYQPQIENFILNINNKFNKKHNKNNLPVRIVGNNLINK